MSVLPFRRELPATMTGLRIRTSRIPAATLVCFAGELDFTNAAEAEQVVLDALRHQNESVVLDIADLHFCDSAGIRLMLSVGIACRDAGREVVIKHPTPIVHRALEITGVDQLIALEH